MIIYKELLVSPQHVVWFLQIKVVYFDAWDTGLPYIAIPHMQHHRKKNRHSHGKERTVPSTIFHSHANCANETNIAEIYTSDCIPDRSEGCGWVECQLISLSKALPYKIVHAMYKCTMQLHSPFDITP